VAELRALAHPLRLRVLELFAEQPRTTKQVALLLGEPPTRLYHHVAALERAGLLRLKETRKNRGTVEKWYEAIARSFDESPTSGPRPRKPRKGAAGRRALAMAVLEQSRQEVVAAMQQRTRERPMLARFVVVASRAQIAEMRKRVHSAVKDLQRDFAGLKGAEPEEAERWALTLTFSPVAGKSRRK
jgi:DNA-binding transcriptional ArsR family regulator